VNPRRDIDRLVERFLEIHGATTEAHLVGNAWWRLKLWLWNRCASRLVATRGRLFIVNDGYPMRLSEVVAMANVEAARLREPPFDLAEIEAAWRDIRARAHDRAKS
jgi:hypothetical protein